MTDQQVRLLRRKRMEGKTQETVAAIAGMSTRSARKWQCGPLPSETKQERWWRTGPIPSTGSGLPALAVRQRPLELCWMLKRRWRRQFGQLWMPRRFLQAIAAELNATGTPGPNGRILSRRHIRQILRNEVYCGTNVLGRRDPDTAVRVPNAFPAIVSQEELTGRNRRRDFRFPLEPAR